MNKFINDIKKKLRIDFDKNTKLSFYLRGIITLYTPQSLYKRDFHLEYKKLNKNEQEYIDTRVKYYNKLDANFSLDTNAFTIKEFISKEKKKTYYFDLLEVAKYFNEKLKIQYIFGDVTTVPEIPSIVKSRPIGTNNWNSVVMKLNKIRHFIFVNDQKKFEEKKDSAVWRGKCYVDHRKKFVKTFYDKTFCDIGQTNTKGDRTVPWQKNKLSIEEQLNYKFIVVIEGNDVASNLKWAMSSNSLVLMAKPKYETWFMEGTLKENYHYVLLEDDYSDMEEKINYYLNNTKEAKNIITNANQYVEQFKNQQYEDLISYFVLEKYIGLCNGN